MSIATRAIRPDEIDSEKSKSFPDAVFEAFNELIIQDYDCGSATVTQDDVVALMVQKGLDRQEIFDKGWLNIEGIYRKAGWQVVFDKPSFRENYPATYEFKRKSQHIRE